MEKEPSKSHITLKKNFELKKQKIHDKFKEMHEIQRIRKDDCYAQIAEEYCLSIYRVKKLIGQAFKTERMPKNSPK